MKRAHRRPPHAPSDYLIEALRQLALRGATKREAASKLGVSERSIGRWAKRFAIPMPTRSAALKSMWADPDQRRWRVERIREGRAPAQPGA